MSAEQWVCSQSQHFGLRTVAWERGNLGMKKIWDLLVEDPYFGDIHMKGVQMVLGLFVGLTLGPGQAGGEPAAHSLELGF